MKEKFKLKMVDATINEINTAEITEQNIRVEFWDPS